MTESTRQQLAKIWLEHERQIADAHNLKTGAESPVETESRLEREQDQIEADLATDWWQRRWEHYPR